LDLIQIIQGIRVEDQQAYERLAYRCKDIALAYLKYKVKTNDAYLSELFPNLEDLAWDCVADLFKQGNEGHLIVLESYFEHYDLDTVKKSTLQTELRKLVFTAVNDGIFRIYGSYDPSLRKLIRNIKLAANDLAEVEVIKVHGENTIRIVGSENYELPIIPVEILEIRLFHRIQEKMNMPEVLRIVYKFLQSQTTYRAEVPIVQFALSLRKVYTRMNEYQSDEAIYSARNFMNGELREIIQAIISRKKEEFHKTYVETGKMTEQLFKVYLKTVEHILHDEYVEDHPEADSYFEHLSRELPQLPKHEYRSHHRQYLEYLTKKVRDDLLIAMKKQFNVSAGNPN